MDGNDLKEKLIIFGISTGAFLPIRILFTTLVSDDWLGSLGLISAFAIVVVVLIKKNKLGWLGRMFERQIKKTLIGRTGKYIIGFAIFFLLYFGATLFFIERANTIYVEDKEIFFSSMVNQESLNVDDLSNYELIGPKIIAQYQSSDMQSLAKLDYMFSISYAVMNEMSDAWLSHIVVVMFVEQVEVIGLLVLFRNIFKPVTQIPQTKNE